MSRSESIVDDSGPSRTLLITDLDGTLRHHGQGVSTRDLATLKALRRAGIAVAIATGRSLYSARRVLPVDFPIDYLLFSSGAGAMHWPDQRLVRAMSFTADEAQAALDRLLSLNVNFMVHRPIPDNHWFLYHCASAEDGTDFDDRCRLYAAYCDPLTSRHLPFGPACQFLAIVRNDAACYCEIRDALPRTTVIRTTSPLTGSCIWVEIFPAGVCKSAASQWLAGTLGIDPRRCYAVGNDYNDIDLLEWAANALVVPGAPADLGGRFPVVPRDDGGDVTAAVAAWGLL